MALVTNEKRLGYDVEATLDFSKTSLKLTSDIVSVNVTIANTRFIPRLSFSYYIDAKYSSMLSVPYKLKLKMIELNTDKTVKSHSVSEWISYMNDSTHIRREKGNPERPERELVHHTFVHKDAYTAMNTEVGGIYENKKLEDVIKDLWNKTNHGSLQLNLPKLDNTQNFEQIWVPNMKFYTIFSYLTQHFGLFETMPMIFTDLKEFKIMSINELIKLYDPLTLFFDNVDKKERKSPPDKWYEIYNYPTIETSFNRLIGTIPKSMNIIKRSKDKLFELEKMDIPSQIKKMNFISANDFFDNMLDDISKPKTQAGSYSYDTFNMQEYISSIATNVIDPVNLTIPAPFRLDDWQVGTKVKIEDEKQAYTNSNIAFYVDALRFDIHQESEHRWDGYVDVEMKATSVRDIYIS